jgi:hypothetical protein
MASQGLFSSRVFVGLATANICCAHAVRCCGDVSHATSSHHDSTGQPPAVTLRSGLQEWCRYTVRTQICDPYLIFPGSQPALVFAMRRRDARGKHRLNLRVRAGVKTAHKRSKPHAEPTPTANQSADGDSTLTARRKMRLRRAESTAMRHGRSPRKGAIKAVGQITPVVV